ncbi:MAG: hypothetical protein ACPG77_12810, partial [Nannocystaceae bacterium]
MNAFLGALCDDHAASNDASALASAWAAAWATAKQSWPDVDVPEEAVASAVVSRLPPGKTAFEGLATLRVSELYLVCGCLRGQRDALQAFEQTYRSQLEAAARRGGASQPEDIVQHL